MMKKYYILLAACALAFASCSDFLELNESVYQTTKFQFSTFDRVKLSATNVYTFVDNGLLNVGQTQIDAASDDAIYAWQTGDIKRFYDGSWSATNLIDDRWGGLYAAISAANYFLENCPSDFPGSSYMDNYKINLEQLKNYPYEVRALRAYYHFELLKRYNNIIIGDRQFSVKEVNSLKPVSYQQAVDWIVEECDSAAKYLPLTYVGSAKAEIARTTRGMALALKARTLLYAASPLNNPSGDKTLYLRAAAAAKEVIDLNAYIIANEDISNNAEAKGLIFGKWDYPSGDYERSNFPVGYEGGNSGVCPSQNLAEAFDMRTGEAFDRQNPTHWNTQHKAAARDPRFAKTILCNDVIFKNVAIQSYAGGRNGAPIMGASPTSYYLRKHIIEASRFVTGNESTFQHISPLFRYAEVLLNYAEALAAATQSATFTGALSLGEQTIDFSISPLEAMNKVRTRYGMPAVESVINYDSFDERLRRERRVELAFEGHRFWDIRRWQIGSQTTKIYGLEITLTSDGSFVYRRHEVQQREWQSKMYFYPIADSERFNNPNLTQNKGWN